MAVSWQSEKAISSRAGRLAGLSADAVVRSAHNQLMGYRFGHQPSRSHSPDSTRKRFVTVCGNACLLPNERFQAHAAELLYHTSRYYIHTQQFLCHLSGDHSFSMAGYRASALSRQQRQVMAGLLCEVPGRWVAIAIIRVVGEVMAGGAGVPHYLHSAYSAAGPQPRECARSEEGYFWRRIETSDVPLLDPLLNFCLRLNVPVETGEREVKLPIGHIYRLLSREKPVVQRVFSRLVKQLRSQGFRILNLERPATPKYHWR
jgi:hypothetical protein